MRLYDYGPSANCYKARLLLAQLGRPYERVPVDIFGGDTLTDEYAQKNPLRSTPVLETDDGRYLQESNAILWYLAEGTKFLPDDPFARARPALAHPRADGRHARDRRPAVPPADRPLARRPT
jgi:glutathione S-transferase